MEKYIDLGTKLGYKAVELQQFVKDNMDRDERALERAAQKEKVDADRKERIAIEKAKADAETEKAKSEAETEKAKAETEKAKAETEKAKIAAEAAGAERQERIAIEKAKTEQARAKLAAEATEAERQERLDIEKMRHEERKIELHLKSASGTDRSEKTKSQAIPRNYPKLPVFKENTDSMDSFLCRFEAHAKAMSWPSKDWPILLSAILDGAALSVFHSLSAIGEVQYEILKESLLRKYQCTTEGFRTKFRTCKPEPAEAFASFGTRLQHLFHRWVDLSQISKTFDNLVELCIMEQFLGSVSKDLAVFLKERSPKSLKDLIDLSENYRLAHPDKLLACKQEEPKLTAFGATPNFGGGENGQQRGAFRGRGYRGRGGRGRSDQGNQENISSNTCRYCKKPGHWAKVCKSRKADEKKKAAEEKTTMSCTIPPDTKVVPTAAAVDFADGSLKYTQGKVNNIPVTVVHDTGAVTAGVRKSLVKPHQYTGETKTTLSFGGNRETFKLAIVPVVTEKYTGNICCCVIDKPHIDLLLGNLEKTQPSPGLFGKVVETVHTDTPVTAVTTRAQAKADMKPTKPLKPPKSPQMVSTDELQNLQKKDDKLKPSFELAKTKQTKTSGKSTYNFELEKGTLIRVFTRNKKTYRQIVVPQTLVPSVLFAAHDTLISGHCSLHKTFDRIRSRFFWPGMSVDTRNYCKSCDICQRTQQKSKTKDIPLDFMPRIDTPFERVAIDLVGPLTPPSEEKHTHLLTIIDVATRYPEAIPLKKIDSISVAEALFAFFARMGIPDEIQTDNGSQFTSEMMAEFRKLLSIDGVRSSPYHAQSNGIIERLHGTLKPMIKKVITAQPRQWHRYLPALLFAIRELPNASTGFSPFQLLFGRQPKGPIDLLANSWRGDRDAEEAKYTFQHVIDLKNVIYDTCKVAHDAVNEARATQKFYHDKKTIERKFAVGDKVLLLLPTTANKLQMQWKGPYTVVKVIKNDYKIDTGKDQKIYHANMLKAYTQRKPAQLAVLPVTRRQINMTPCDEIVGDECCPQNDPPTAVAVLACDEDGQQDIETVETAETATTSWKDAHIDDDLSHDQVEQIKEVFRECSDCMKETPGASTGKVLHEIAVTTETPTRKKQYPLPFAAYEEIKREVQELLELGIIEPSTSPYCSPVVLVPKKDSQRKRMCLDLRGLNEITVFDAEPIPDQEEIFTRLSGAKFFSKFDLAKGYFQIFIHEKDRHKTAFQTPMGLMQFRRVPFGLVSAPATFARAMREALGDTAINFFDDVLVASDNWQSHIKEVRETLHKLRDAGFTVKPKKVFAGFRRLEFLGHVIGDGELRPTIDNVRNILKIATPATKKQVRSMLGMTGYYKKFIPAYSALTAPISDLTAGRPRGPITWTDECERAFGTIRELLSKGPILKLPDLKQPFVVRTDASGRGIGGVLLQEHDGILHPVSYASRKLLDRETRYSTIERECLAVIWTLGKFQRYLWGKTFSLETDHRPLTYLTSSTYKNARIMRWALTLQEYNFVISSIRGEDNIFADILSRSEVDQSVPVPA